jgi:hypothetical protein
MKKILPNWFYKDLFRMPKFIKPELNKPIYYVHIVILAVVVLGTLQYFTGGDMLNVKNVLYSIPLLTFGDFWAHTILGLN